MRYDIVPLQNLCEMITRGITPRYIEDGTGLVVINQKCIRDNRVSLDAARRHNVSEKPVMEGRKIRCHDILVNSTGTGTLGRVGQVKAQNIVATVDSHVTIVRPNPVIVDPTYLGYALIWKQPDIEALAEGSTGQTELSRTRLGEEITVPVPPLAIQKKAASILSSLDARIDVNRQLNDNLLRQADLLFKSWFLDYTPWNGKRPGSWVSGKLGEYTEIKRGGSPRPIQEYLSESGLRWLKISDVTSLNSPFIIDIKDHIIEAGLRKTVFLSAGSLVLSNSATPGIPKILDVDSCIHDGWLYFPKSVFSKEFLYLFFRYIRQQLVNLSNGSVFNNLKTDILKEYPTILPDTETLHRFDETVKPMFDRMQSCARESRMLAELRNVLLPRLLSGEIDISNVTF